MTRQAKLTMAGVLAIGVVLALGAWAQAPDAEGLTKKADVLFEQKNYKEAADLYDKALEAKPKPERIPYVCKQIVGSKLRLRLFDDALEEAERYIKLTTDTYQETRAERFTGNLYMLVPHWGTRAGGEFFRAEHKQGIRLDSTRHDKKIAIKHLERARDLYAKWDQPPAGRDVMPAEDRKGWHVERIECLFDLASTVSRFTIYENSWRYWYSWWGERDEFLAETAGEEDFDEYHNYWEYHRKRPIGLRLDPDGKPIFPYAPKNYSADQNDDQKILYLLAEVRELDKTENDQYTALSYYRQAMLARTRFGMDRLNSYAGFYYWGGKYPLREELEDHNPWELKDDEAIVLAGGRVTKLVLPDQYNVMKLLRLVAADYPKSGVADQSQYAVGCYYQSRQQYLEALREYDDLKKGYAKSKWVAPANQQITRIKAPQVQISQMGVQLPGQPAEVQVSYRNTGKVWFVAREIDLKGFLTELRTKAIDNEKHRSWQWQLASWHGYFVRQAHKNNWDYWIREMAAKYVGPEVQRWADEVKDDGTHRYAHVTLQSPIKERGVYIIYGYLNEPPKDHAQKKGLDLFALGNSRAVMALTDLAIVEKKTAKGNLYFIADAAGGAPVPGANVSILEIWHTWDSKKRFTTYHTEMHELTTDKQGIVIFPRPDNRNSQLHLLVTAQDKRLAWSGMHYWSRYHPSRMRDGRFAYVITDRPVYRPLQQVNFKLWMRRMQNGILSNLPGTGVSITVYDPRGNKVHSETCTTDQFGGADGKFKLSEEPTLGVYRLQVHTANYVGGQNFRVEEYKKPEFEVTVEPAKSHMKLGEKVTALIKATYYFGAPVTEATVKYRVFREEYRHTYYPPGVWDWLYGPGYGYGWYGYDWFPWWGAMRCCWAPPSWWWGWYGYPAPTPVRELVKEGNAHIGADGTLKVEIDTAAALRDHGDLDHRYVVEAEVRDASRRVITGEGAVKVTRQAYYAFINSNRGYYRPGEEMQLTIRCLTPGNEPVSGTEGLITVSRIVFGGPDNAHMEETQLKRWTARTDERGIITFRMRHERSDQLKFTFEAPDEWGGKVTGYGLVWVCGRDFDGKLYRFNNLELLTDKRTYQPGEVCHLMINTQHANSYVLFADDVDNNHLISWKLLHLPDKHVVVDIPIKKEHRPNFFMEATTVAGGRVHQQAKRLCVPPEGGIMNVTVATDKPEYKPGEKARVTVTAKDLDGKPAQAQVVVSAFDKSVLYIQPEMTPDIKRFFHGNVRTHYLQMMTNLTAQFSAVGYVDRPFYLHHHLMPPNWYGTWGPIVGDWRTVNTNELKRMEGARGGGGVAGAVNGLGFATEREESVASDAGGGAPMAAAGPVRKSGEMAKKIQGADKDRAAAPAEPAYAQAEVRQKFADTALWLTTLTTDADGVASTTVEMPENLTTWKVNTWAMTRETRVGQTSTEAVTTKNLLVRLQAPRFFIEYDEVVISANIHNYLDTDKKVKAILELEGDTLEQMLTLREQEAIRDAEKEGITGEFIPVKEHEIEVPANGEKRVDWRVRVKKEGIAAITVKALTDEESDAMKMSFPVLVHGITKQVATTGSMQPDEKAGVRTVEIVIPNERKPELSQLEVQFAPSLVGAMLDALPYCMDYPYGCTEQTVSRFMPAVLTLKTLQNMGLNLEDLKNIRGRMEEIRRIEKGERIRIYSYIDNPVFDTEEMNALVDRGLNRIISMQNGDGGWGWWTGSSSGYMSSYVLNALVTAQQCDVKVDENMIRRGMNYLKRWEEGEMRRDYWGPHAQHAFACYVLSLRKMRPVIKPAKGDKRPGDCIERLFVGRDKLSLYGKALLSMTLANHGDQERARLVLRNIMQYREENKETELVWFRTPGAGWWYWWNSDIEANAWVLRAIIRLEPKSADAPKLVKWLLENRRNGYYWRSTRDTTMCVAAMSDFVVASGEGKPDYTLTLDFDNGKVVKKVKINKDNFFTYDNRFVLEGVALTGGKHTLKITKTGAGALYYSTYLRYFTKERDIKAAGLQLKIERRYFKLVQIPYEVEVDGAEGQKIMEKRLRYERVPLKTGDQVDSGDTIQVELQVESDNNYTYLCFEDMKPAGCEPIDVRSGGKAQEGFATYMELRDEKVVFFLRNIEQGKHLLRYRTRAEVPGTFHALPSIIYGMYVPELRANSNEHVMKIADK